MNKNLGRESFLFILWFKVVCIFQIKHVLQFIALQHIALL